MLSELDRKILKAIMEADRPVSNRELSLHCGAAINTIRKEIGLINEEIKRHGFVIASRTSVGNYLEIVNPRAAGPYLERLKSLYKRNQRMDNRYPTQVHYLIRRLLCSGGGLTVEGLCQELYCSRGTILGELNQVRRFLNSYGLTLKNRRSSQGLVVEGGEWNRRQCLIYQHKILKNTMEDESHGEYGFKTLFFMMDGIDRYEMARQDLMECLREQDDFTIPILHFPKIIHYMQLSVTRRKYTSEIQFGEEQRQRAENTPEYDFARRLWERIGARYNQKPEEQDVLALSILLLSYETQNRHLKEMEEYAGYYEETLEMIRGVTAEWGYSCDIFDDTFVEDWILFLYTLKNRLIFGVYTDPEVLGYVERKGIRSSDFCLYFARFYEEKHGIRLSRENAMSAFYLFHRLLKRDSYCYYAQNILVISQYGISCAKSLAANIRKGYGTEVGLVTPGEICQYMEEEPEEYDLLMTDLDRDRQKYLTRYGLPVLTVEFRPGQYRCPELDDYLKGVQKECEQTILKDDCFYRTALKSKQEVFAYLDGLFAKNRIEEDKSIDVKKELEENDAHIELERENGVVLLPVFDGAAQQQIFVLINRKAFVWNENRSQIFVCYNRTPSLKANQMLNGVLRRFVHIRAETVDALIHGDRDPKELLFGSEIFIV